MRTCLLALLFFATFSGIGFNSLAQNTKESIDNLILIGVRANNITVYVNCTGEIAGFNLGQQNFEMDYYDRYDDAKKQGKIKEVGPIKFDYYDRFDDENKQGKLKKIGAVAFDYYDKFSWEELKGKLKSIGETELEYYDRFSINDPQGKLKSIGSLCIEYYTKFDGEKAGLIKSVSGGGKDVFVGGFSR